MARWRKLGSSFIPSSCSSWPTVRAQSHPDDEGEGVQPDFSKPQGCPTSSSVCFHPCDALSLRGAAFDLTSAPLQHDEHELRRSSGSSEHFPFDATRSRIVSSTLPHGGQPHWLYAQTKPHKPCK